MSQCISTIALLGAVSLTAACGSDHAASGTGGSSGIGGTNGSGGTVGSGGTSGDAGTECTGDSGTDPCPAQFPTCVSGEIGVFANFPYGLCTPSGFPFVTYTFPTSDCASCVAPSSAGGTIRLSQPVSGTLCLSGTSQATGNGILLDFTVYSSEMLTLDNQTVLKIFNAKLKGITQVRFTIDNPPSGGVELWADSISSTNCGTGLSCFTGAYTVAKRITESGTTTVPLTDFILSGQTIDTRALNNITFQVDPGTFNYCLHDFQFLDINGAVVEP